MLHSLTRVEVDDWKCYCQVIEADTSQSRSYPLLLMCLNPSLERVTFVLEFVRSGVSRCAEYTRKDLPWLNELALRERTLQRKLHELVCSGDRDLNVSPGRHCTWCPLLLNGCPVEETNPYHQMTAEERLGFVFWLHDAERRNIKVLKDFMVDRRAIRYQHENQSEYVADFVPAEKNCYPYRDAVSILDEWFRTYPDERGLRNKPTVSGSAQAFCESGAPGGI